MYYTKSFRLYPIFNTDQDLKYLDVYDSESLLYFIIIGYQMSKYISSDELGNSCP